MLDFSKFNSKFIKCAGLGEVLFDVYPTGAKIGGAPANFAFHCAQQGLRAMTISAVGHDKLGFEAREYLAAKFMPALLLDSDKQTGAVNVELSATGVPSYSFVDDTAYDNIPCSKLVLDTVAQLDMICFGSLAQRNEVSRKTIMMILDHMREGAIRVFDVNLRGSFYSKEIVTESIKRSEILKCNEDELPILARYAGLNENASANEYYQYLKEQGIDCFIFTEGALQSTVFLNDEISTVKTPKVEAIDTVGAGDSFTATIISRLMRGYTLKEAHKRAVKVAAFVCTQSGAMPEQPSELIV